MILILCQSAGGLFVLLKKLKNLSCGGVTVKGKSEVPPGVCKPESKSDCLQLGVYFFFYCLIFDRTNRRRLETESVCERRVPVNPTSSPSLFRIFNFFDRA